MGSYLNPSSERFQTSLRSEIYVDKSMLIAQINRRVRTEQKFMYDIALALMAVQTQTTAILDEFPTKAAETEQISPV